MSLKGFQKSKVFRKDANLYGIISYGDRDLRPNEVRALVAEGIKAGYDTLNDIPDEFVDKVLADLHKPAPKDTQTQIAFKDGD